MSQFTYPHTIDNGAGERLTFLRLVQDEQGERLEVENVVAPGAGPVMHVHYHQTEALTVRSGRIGYQLPGGEAQYAGAGETVEFKAGVPHRFWNAGEEPLHCTGWIGPAHNIVFFLDAIFTSARENGEGRPHPIDAAFLTRRYRREFGMIGIPKPVQTLLFPILVAAGRLTGRLKKYRDAPEPVIG